MSSRPGKPKKRSEKSQAQRRAAAKKSRPGLAPLSAGEERERTEATRINRGLCLRVSRLVDDRVHLTEIIHQRVREEIDSQRPDFGMIRALLDSALTNIDLNALLGQLEDRYGQPRRTVQDVKLEGALQMPIILGDEGQRATWGKREEEHAARTDAPPDGS